MQRIKINNDPKAFTETNNVLTIRIDPSSDNGIILSDGVLSVSNHGRVATISGNKASNGIVGESRQTMTTVVGCNSTVSRRRKYTGGDSFILANEGPYIPDFIRVINPAFGYDDEEMPSNISPEDESDEA